MAKVKEIAPKIKILPPKIKEIKTDVKEREESKLEREINEGTASGGTMSADARPSQAPILRAAPINPTVLPAETAQAVEVREAPRPVVYETGKRQETYTTTTQEKDRAYETEQSRPDTTRISINSSIDRPRNNPTIQPGFGTIEGEKRNSPLISYGDDEERDYMSSASPHDIGVQKKKKKEY